MNLVEALMGGMVFTLSSTCSLQIYSSSLRWTATAQKHQQLASAIDAELLAHPARAATSAAALLQEMASSDSCDTAADVLTESLGTYPTIAPGGEGKIERAFKRNGDLLLVVVEAADLPKPQRQRERWLHPAVYGLCGASPQPKIEPDADGNDSDVNDNDVNSNNVNGNDGSPNDDSDNHGSGKDVNDLAADDMGANAAVADDAYVDAANSNDESSAEPGQP